jgi:hypothetical protein
MRERKKLYSVPPAQAPGNMRRRLMFIVAWGGVVVAAYFGGRYGTPTKVRAEPVARAVTNTTPSDYARRPVAAIFGSITISREELGEFLIARYGKERLSHLINKRIIEQAARQKGVEVTAAEVNAALAADAQQFQVSPREFEKQVLKRYQKSLYEWKEDVIRPRLMMEKMCRARVVVSREDVVKAYEAHFGEKVDCKIIMWPREEKNTVLHKVWPLLRNEEQFDHYARSQVSPSLASVGGHVKPLGHHTTGDEKLEKTLFNLKPGEVSEVLDNPEGLVVVKCLGRIPPDTKASYDERRPALEKEVFEKKLQMEIGKLFTELRAQAQPKNFLEPTNVVEDVQKELSNDPLTRQAVGSAAPATTALPPAAVSGATAQPSQPPAWTPPVPASASAPARTSGK